MGTISKLLALALCWLPFADASNAQEYSPIGTFGEWQVYKDGADCWIGAQPTATKNADVSDLFVYVTFFDRDPDPNFSLVTTLPVQHHSKLAIRTQDAEYKLTFAEDTAFPLQRDELTILRSLLDGDDVRFVFAALDGQEVSGLVPTEGFKQAYNELSSICDFRFNNKLSVENGVEPS